MSHVRLSKKNKTGTMEQLERRHLVLTIRTQNLVCMFVSVSLMLEIGDNATCVMISHRYTGF